MSLFFNSVCEVEARIPLYVLTAMDSRNDVLLSFGFAGHWSFHVFDPTILAASLKFQVDLNALNRTELLNTFTSNTKDRFHRTTTELVPYQDNNHPSSSQCILTNVESPLSQARRKDPANDDVIAVDARGRVLLSPTDAAGFQALARGPLELPDALN